MKRVLKIVFVIIGTIVGAGFASGKEIYSFFFVYGASGVCGLVLACLIMGVVIYRVLRCCYKNEVREYEEFCEVIESKVKGSRFKNVNVSRIFSGVINAFLLIMFYVMISGFSSFLFQEFNVNRIAGSFIIVILCYFTFVGNIDKLMKISNYLIPFLIVFIIFISGKSLLTGGIGEINELFNYICVGNSNGFFGGIFKGVLYASYNCIVLIPVLIQLSNSVKIDRKNSLLISIISATMMCILSFAVYNLLLHGDLQIFNLEMPIIGVSKSYGVWYGLVYSVIIGIAIFTSAASSGVRFFK